jgi:pyrimidine-nucleoside phosphorylase
MLVLGRIAADRPSAERLVRGAIASGAGLERFRRIVENQGGDPHIVDDYRRLPSAPDRHLVRAGAAGYLTSLDAELVGRASVILGAGRDRVEDPVDYAVGIMLMAKPGDQLSVGDAVLELHYRDAVKRDRALELANRAFTIGDQRPAARAVIVGEVH